MLPRWEESPSEGLGELHPLEAETLVPEELETEVLQKKEEEEDGLGILQYLDQLEQVTARFLSRLVLFYQYGIYKKCSLSHLFLKLIFFIFSMDFSFLMQIKLTSARVDIVCNL
jgi:hypothetical protein